MIYWQLYSLSAVLLASLKFGRWPTEAHDLEAFYLPDLKFSVFGGSVFKASTGIHIARTDSDAFGGPPRTFTFFGSMIGANKTSRLSELQSARQKSGAVSFRSASASLRDCEIVKSRGRTSELIYGGARAVTTKTSKLVQMPDYAVHMTWFNDTNEVFAIDWPDTIANLGHWVDLPKIIPAGQSASFQIADDPGLYGSDANNRFNILSKNNTKLGQISTYECCPYLGSENKFVPQPITPSAVYTSSFRAKVGNGPWRYNYVEKSGAPMYVKFRIGYQPLPYHFTLVAVTATSALYLRNSRGDLVGKSHTLWSSASPYVNDDGPTGSFEPNIFGYDFKAPKAPAVQVTIRAIDTQLIGAEAIVYGMHDDKIVLRTAPFFIKDLNNVVLDAHIIDPFNPKYPFRIAGDIVWMMELHQSSKFVTAVGPNTTRLELFGTAPKAHIAFWNGVPVGFLRAVFDQREKAAGSTHLKSQLTLESAQWYKAMTSDVFTGYSKIYDTLVGASAFGMAFWGGIFSQAYYRACRPGSTVLGSLYRHVNCYDQAGWLELSCSFSEVHETSWLGQQPFGFIQTTHLVGVCDVHDNPIAVNNPFFGTDQARALVGNDDTTRTYFYNHVYVGNARPFEISRDAIYDACAGPHEGTEDANQYIATSIQSADQTTLYAVNRMYPGSANNIQEGDGVTGIDGSPYQPNGPNDDTLRSATSALRSAATTSAHLLVSRLAPASQASDGGVRIAHEHWASAALWAPAALGAGWSVPFVQTAVAANTVRAFFHVEGPDEDSLPLRITVVVESRARDDGFDAVGASAAARARAGELVANAQRDPETLWTSGAPELAQFGDASMQYQDGVGGGRVLLLAANTVVDISGASSSTDLLPLIRPLLAHVVRRDAPLPQALRLSNRRVIAPPRKDMHGVEIEPPAGAAPHAREEQDRVIVEGVETRFILEFTVDDHVAAASSWCPNAAVLLDRYEIVYRTLRFHMVTCAQGTHNLQLHVAHGATLVSTTTVVQVDVV